MTVITKDDLASLVDTGRSVVDTGKSVFDDRMAAVSNIIKKEEVSTTKDNKKIIKVTLIVMGVVVCVCGAAYALYKYFTPDYDDEFDDEFDDAFDDDDDDFDDDDDDDDED